MNILWSVNTIFPYPANRLGIASPVFGGWLLSLMEGLNGRKEIKKLGIATVYNGKDLKKYVDGKIIYYLVPKKNINKYSKVAETYWHEVVLDFQPNIIHIHGTEFPHSLELLNASKNIKNCTSIQGLVTLYGEKDVYNGEIKDSEIIKNITLRDILKNDLWINQYKNFVKRSVYEKELLTKTNLVVGRTTWDKENSRKISGNKNYVVCNESLRSNFYDQNWNIKDIIKHSIFVSQATYPIKGFHTVVEVLNILKEKYPDIKVFVAGNNLIHYKDNFKGKLKISGYGLYLKKLINKYQLEENIEFIGLVDAEKLGSYLLKSNLYLQASSIENSSNSLGEAMIIGMPIVASNVGGTKDMIVDKEEGFLYPFGNIELMAKYITEIFENEDLAKQMGIKAQKHAKKTHSKEINVNKMIEIYKSLNRE